MSNADYNGYLLKFMSYRDKKKYEKGHKFSENELLLITPKDISEYFCFKAYKKEPQHMRVDAVSPRTM